MMTEQEKKLILEKLNQLDLQYQVIKEALTEMLEIMQEVINTMNLKK